MGYRNKQKEREATRKRVRRYRDKKKNPQIKKGVTSKPESRLMWIQGRLARIYI